MVEFLLGVLFSLGVFILIIVGLYLYEPVKQVQYDKETVEKYYYFNCSNVQSKDCTLLEKFFTE